MKYHTCKPVFAYLLEPAPLFKLMFIITSACLWAVNLQVVIEKIDHASREKIEEIDHQLKIFENKGYSIKD